MPTEDFQARGLGATKPTAARLYDYYLGGTAHYDIDKVFAEHMFKICPYLDVLAQHNRQFLQRAVRYLAGECGIRQFLDIGSGIPTVGNTHHVAREVISDARVVYVDKDLEAVHQSWELLTRENATSVTVIEGDLREPDTSLDHLDTRRLIDFNEPVGLLMIAVWPFISDDEQPYELMVPYRDRLASGSYVAMCQNSLDEVSDEVREIITAVTRAYDDTADPRVVYAPDWHPVEPVDTDDPIRPWNLVAVARKP